MNHAITAALDAGLDAVRRAPADDGTVELIVCRPAFGEREVLSEGVLDVADGLVGDMWRWRRTPSTADGSPNPDKQLSVMSAPVAALLAGPPEDWPPAGDQLYIDLDLSEANLPAGARLAIGTAVIEVTATPHLGCAKFSARFGPAALKFVSTPAARKLRLRGVHAKVVVPGVVRPGDRAGKVASSR